VPEIVTVICVRHRRRVTRGLRTPVTGAVIWHADGVADGPPCDSREFLVRREQVVSRDGADAELLVLDLNRKAAAAAAREHEES
jgi:hypothetical protein